MKYSRFYFLKYFSEGVEHAVIRRAGITSRTGYEVGISCCVVHKISPCSSCLSGSAKSSPSRYQFHRQRPTPASSFTPLRIYVIAHLLTKPTVCRVSQDAPSHPIWPHSTRSCWGQVCGSWKPSSEGRCRSHSYYFDSNRSSVRRAISEGRCRSDSNFFDRSRSPVRRDISTGAEDGAASFPQIPVNCPSHQQRP